MIEIEDLVGSRLVIGFPGTRVTPEVLAHFRALRAGGVIFYRINYESPAQIRGLVRDLEEGMGRRLLVCVDHEGGRVVMYGGGVTVFPDNMAIGRTRNIEHARAMGRIAAAELRAMATDVNFAPTVDVITAPFSPNIGIRAFGEDRRLVADMGAAYISALQAGGVAATAKHFPGSGAAQIDAHLRLPTLPIEWEEVQEVHAQPFMAAIKANVEVIMSSHPRYPRLDPAPGQLATFSRRIITDYLRGELGFKGVIASDDLEMGAVRETCPMPVAAVKTAAAGHDLLLSCHDFDLQRQVFTGLVDAYRGRLLPLSELEESVERVRILRERRPRVTEDLPYGPMEEGVKLAKKIAREGLTIYQDPARRLPLDRSMRTAVIFPDMGSLAQRIMIESPFHDCRAWIEARFAALPRHDGAVYALDPTNDDIDHAAELAHNAQSTVLFLYDAHLHPREQQLLNAVQKASANLIVVFLRDPYDRAFLRPADTALTAFGFRACQIDAVMERLLG